MDEDQDDGRERGDEPLTARPLLDWGWWPKWHDETIARQKAEAAQLKALNWALERIFDEH